MNKLILDELNRGRCEQTEAGLLIPLAGVGDVLAIGEYTHRKNGGPWEIDWNTVTTEWLNYILETGMRGGTAQTAWYMALFGTGYTPTAGLTAATFAATAGENTSLTEGYTSATRPTFTMGAAATGQVNNTAAPVTFTFASATTVDIGGIAIISENTRGGTTGVLASATQLSNARTFEDADTYEVTYRLRFTPA